MTYMEIGKELGISKQRAKQIFDTGMRKLKCPAVARHLRDCRDD